jgi:hypothetical protein
MLYDGKARKDGAVIVNLPVQDGAGLSLEYFIKMTSPVEDTRRAEDGRVRALHSYTGSASR